MAKKQKEIKLPNKTEMNLFVVENDNAKQLPYFIVGLIVVGVFAFLFAQFLVIGRLNKLNDLQREVNSLQNTYNEQLVYLSDREEVKEKYRRYTTVYLTKNNEKIVDRVDIINLINSCVADHGYSSSFSIADNAVSFVVITDDQEELAAIRNNFEENKLVRNVEVSTSSTTGYGVQSTIFMNVRTEDE